jgi:pimeloyl-ACP methyl ester carboxylesterase
MVHGMMSSRAQWILNLGKLKDFCRPVVVELFGHGRSPSPADPEAYYPDSYIEEFERIRKKLGIERWFICGQSLGASLTLRYSLYCPGHIIAQIFTNSRSAFMTNPTEKTMKSAAEHLQKGGRASLDNVPLNPSKSRHLKAEVKEALLKDIDLINIKGLANNLQYLVTGCSVRDLIQQNEVPTLLVAGRFDQSFSPFIEFIEKTMPQLEVEVLDGGHAVNIDAADQFNEAVKKFILSQQS